MVNVTVSVAVNVAVFICITWATCMLVLIVDCQCMYDVYPRSLRIIQFDINNIFVLAFNVKIPLTWVTSVLLKHLS